MKKLLAAAAFLLVSTAAHAQITFEYDGHIIRIDPDRGTVSIPGVYDNTGRHAKKAKTDKDSSRKQQVPQEARTEPPQPAKTVEPPAASAATDHRTPPPASTAVARPSLPEPPATTNDAPAETSVPPSSPPLPASEQAKRDAAPTEPPLLTPAAALPTAPPPSVEQPAQTAAAPIRDPGSPVGIWLTQEKEGKVRIEQCGSNLCGYSVDANSNQNGEQVLINMKPDKDQQWTGRILDPSTGSTYDSTIAMRGPSQLSVRGCALGGMFCGDQTWSRVD